MYFRARYYSPQLGQFISRDPLGYVDGMSQYRGYFVPGTVDPFGNEVPGIHHPLSLFLGGSNKQLGIHLDATQHTAVHNSLREQGWGYNSTANDRFSKLTRRRQSEIIRESLEAANLGKKTVNRLMRSAFKGAKFGVGTTRRGKGRSCFNRRAIRGTAGATALVGVLALAQGANAEEALGAMGDSLDPFAPDNAVGGSTSPRGCILARVCSTYAAEYEITERLPSMEELVAAQLSGRVAPNIPQIVARRIGGSIEKELVATVSFGIQSGTCSDAARALGGSQTSVLSVSPSTRNSGTMKIKECKWVIGYARNTTTFF